jgi:copper chaperone
MILNVTGMTCQHCVSAVTKALQGVTGVESAEVSLEDKQAVVMGDADSQALVQAVKSEGYDAAVKS